MNAAEATKSPRWLQRFKSSALAPLLANAAANGLDEADGYLLDDLCALSECRSDGAVTLLFAALLSLKDGSVCLEVSQAEIARRLEGLADETELQRLSRLAIQELEKGACNPLMFNALGGVDPAAPLFLRKHGDRKLLYLQKYLRHEARLQELLFTRLRAKAATVNTAELNACLVAVRAASENAGQRLNDEQVAACAMSLLQSTLIITGGPGTGKTSVVVSALACHLRNGVKPSEIALACPTGRAAQRLSEAVRQRLPQLAGEAVDESSVAMLEATTLHRLLGYSSRAESYRHHRENPLPHSLVIIDETSMLDIVLMARLLDALRPQTRLILLGDKDQLPSVDAGSVLADLVPAGGPSYSAGFCKVIETVCGIKLPARAETGTLTDKVVVLRTNHRSQKHIQEIAATIISCDAASADSVIESLPRQGAAAPRPAVSGRSRVRKERVSSRQMLLFADVFQEGEAKPSTAIPATNRINFSTGGFTLKDAAADGGCWFLPSSEAQFGDVLSGWAKRAYNDHGYMDLVGKARAPGAGECRSDPAIEKVFGVIQSSRVLTLLRDGPSGCTGINTVLARMLRSDHRRSAQFFPGAPALVTANDYSRQLFNGDVGVCLRDEENALRIVFERRGESGAKQYISYAAETLYGCELAFAMTVHKAQGSEFHEVLLALPFEGGERLLNRQMIYTAITRARKLALICGAQNFLNYALSRGVERCSGLSL